MMDGEQYRPNGSAKMGSTCCGVELHTNPVRVLNGSQAPLARVQARGKSVTTALHSTYRQGESKSDIGPVALMRRSDSVPGSFTLIDVMALVLGVGIATSSWNHLANGSLQLPPVGSGPANRDSTLVVYAVSLLCVVSANVAGFAALDYPRRLVARGGMHAASAWCVAFAMAAHSHAIVAAVVLLATPSIFVPLLLEKLHEMNYGRTVAAQVVAVVSLVVGFFPASAVILGLILGR